MLHVSSCCSCWYHLLGAEQLCSPPGCPKFEIGHRGTCLALATVADPPGPVPTRHPGSALAWPSHAWATFMTTCARAMVKTWQVPLEKRPKVYQRLSLKPDVVPSSGSFISSYTKHPKSWMGTRTTGHLPSFFPATTGSQVKPTRWNTMDKGQALGSSELIQHVVPRSSGRR